MSANAYRWVAFLAIIVAGHAAYWFIAGHAADASDVRAVLVGAQLAVGLAVAAWAWLRARRAPG